MPLKFFGTFLLPCFARQRTPPVENAVVGTLSIGRSTVADYTVFLQQGQTPIL